MGVFVKYGVFSCSVKMVCKLAEAGLMCGQAPATAVILRLEAKDTPCILGILDQNYFIIA